MYATATAENLRAALSQEQLKAKLVQDVIDDLETDLKSNRLHQRTRYILTDALKESKCSLLNMQVNISMLTKSLAELGFPVQTQLLAAPVASQEEQALAALSSQVDSDPFLLDTWSCCE